MARNSSLVTKHCVVDNLNKFSSPFDDQGDSGGPLVCGNGNGGFDVIGVVSFGPSSCGGMPGVFTEVSQFIDWITHNAGQI